MASAVFTSVSELLTGDEVVLFESPLELVSSHSCSTFSLEDEDHECLFAAGLPATQRLEVWRSALCVGHCARAGEYEALLGDAGDDAVGCGSHILEQIELDVARTFASRDSFSEPQRQQLQRVLQAFVARHPDPGYRQGMSYIAAVLLHVCADEEEVFWMFVCLMNQGLITGYFSEEAPLLRQHLRVFCDLVDEVLPDLAAHFEREGVDLAAQFLPWMLTLFAQRLPLEAVLPLWDAIVSLGVEEVVPISLTLLEALKYALLTMDFDELSRTFASAKFDDSDDPLSIGLLLVKRARQVVSFDRVQHLLNSWAAVDAFECLPSFEFEFDNAFEFHELTITQPPDVWQKLTAEILQGGRALGSSAAKVLEDFGGGLIEKVDALEDLGARRGRRLSWWAKAGAKIGTKIDAKIDAFSDLLDSSLGLEH